MMASMRRIGFDCVAGLAASGRINTAPARIDPQPPRVLYPAGRIGAGPYGGTGRRVRLKIGFRKECWFDSG
jgi:hypothetical protein